MGGIQGRVIKLKFRMKSRWNVKGEIHRAMRSPCPPIRKLDYQTDRQVSILNFLRQSDHNHGVKFWFRFLTSKQDLQRLLVPGCSVPLQNRRECNLDIMLN